MNFKLFFLPLFLVILYSCVGKSKLPETMPEQTTISYSESYGMSPYFITIEITGDTLTFTEHPPAINVGEIKWFKKIKIADKEKLYKLFVKNKFDKIKNKQAKKITYDAPSKGISIILSPDIMYNAHSNANFLLSDKDGIRFYTIVNAIKDLATKYKSP